MIQALTLIATLTFSGTTPTTVTLARIDAPGFPFPAALTVKRGTMELGRYLTRHELMGWAYAAAAFASADTIDATWRKRTLPETKATFICTASICRGNLAGPGYSLTPGPFPKTDMRILARLLYLAAGVQSDSMPTIPFYWRQQ